MRRLEQSVSCEKSLPRDENIFAPTQIDRHLPPTGELESHGSQDRYLQCFRLLLVITMKLLSPHVNNILHKSDLGIPFRNILLVDTKCIDTEGATSKSHPDRSSGLAIIILRLSKA